MPGSSTWPFWTSPKRPDFWPKKHGRAHWLPVGIQPEFYLGEHQGDVSHDGVFVGVVNRKVRPKRSALLDLLSEVAPIEIMGGRGGAWFPTEKAAAAYRSHYFVLNENLFPEVTTRPLEVMASGGALLTEEAPGAMDVHFKDGEHLLYFSPANLEEKIKLLLDDGGLRGRIARAGRQIVLEGHTLAHRAQRMVELIEETARTRNTQPSRAIGRMALYLEGRALFMAGLRWPGKGGPQRVMAGAGRILAAAGDQDRPTPMAKWAGLAALVLGEADICLKYLQMAADSGANNDRLALALAAAQLGKPQIARQAFSTLDQKLEDTISQGAPASPHHAAARILAAEGRHMVPGFDGRSLPPAMWSALEHMIKACREKPENGALWEELGDLLMVNNAPNEAHHFYTMAEKRRGSSNLNEKLGLAAEKGYLRWARP